MDQQTSAAAGLLSACKHGAKRCLEALLWLCPVQKDKVLFINFSGKGYGCNPKYIAEEILHRDLAYDMVWLVNNPDEPMPGRIRRVPYKSVRALYEVATAKVIVTNVKNDLRFFKKKSQYVILTWHGSYSAKYLEGDAAGKLPEEYLRESRANSRQTDLFLSNSRVLSDCYRSAFWCECEIMESGFPRNDILFRNGAEIRSKVLQWFHLPADSRLVLYAPTFRDDGSTEGYQIDCHMVHDVLSRAGTEWKVLVRMHPNVGDCAELFRYDGDILEATSYPDMQELLMAADVLITDYSSSTFEFAALGKPAFIFASDIEQYEKTRGLQKAFFSMPYPICRSNEELRQAVEAFDTETAAEQAKAFMQIFGGVDDGHASERVVDRIEDVMHGNGHGPYRQKG